MKDTLVILCETVEEALRAAQRVSLLSDLTKLFLFIDNEPNNQDLDWIDEPDLFIHIDRAKHWSKDIKELGIRVGIAYTDGANVYVCYGKNCPTASDIKDMQMVCDSQTGHKDTNKLKGVSREYFVVRETETKETRSNDNGLEIAAALRGEEASLPAVMEAILEVVPLSEAKFINKPEQQDDLNEFHKIICEKLASRITSDAESKILYAEKTTPKELINVIMDTKTNGCIIFVSKPEQEGLYDLSKSYRKFKTKKCFISVFRGTKK